MSERTIGGLLEQDRRAYERVEQKLRRRQFRVIARGLLRQDQALSRADLGRWGAAARQRLMVLVGEGARATAREQTVELGVGLHDVSMVSQRSTARWLQSLDQALLGRRRRLAWNTEAWRSMQAGEVLDLRLRGFQRSFVRYGATVVTEIEQAVLGLQVGMPWKDVRARVAKATREIVADKDWMVDRIVRTEISTMYNGITQRALEAEDDPPGSMRKKLIAKFDNATGMDSVLLDGQSQLVREPFYDSFNGREFMHPPNRPNDRERMVGWRERWGSDKRRASKRVAVVKVTKDDRRRAAAAVTAMERRSLETAAGLTTPVVPARGKAVEREAARLRRASARARQRR